MQQPRAPQATFQDENRMGISLSTRPVTSISNRIGYKSDHPESENTIQERAWTLDAMLARFAYLDTYNWNTTLPSHTVIKKLRIPQDLLVSAPASLPFSAFQFWRGDIEIEAQVTSTPLAQGMLAMTFIPLSSEDECDKIVENFSSMTVNQTCYLYANANTAAKMTIPFNTPQSYLNVPEFSASSPLNSLGYLYLVVFNPMELGASASDTGSVSLFTSFVNNNFKVLRSRVDNVVPPILSQRQPSNPTTNARFQSADPISLLSDIAKTVLPDHLVDDALTIGKMFTMLDKPTDPRSQQPTPIVSNGRMNFARGVEYIDKLTPYPDLINPATVETFATDVDETDFSYLCKRYSYLGSFKFTTDSAKGTQLAYFPLNPFPAQLTNKSMTQIPLLSYLSAPHKFWTGSLTYKIQVVSTSFQTGKIFFSFNYGNFNPSALPTAIETTSQYGVAFELNQGSNELEFTVPYVSITPYLNVPNSNTPSERDTMGYMRIISINPLVANNSTPTSVNVNIFIAGGDDFKLTALTTGNQLIPFQSKRNIETFKSQKSDFVLIDKPKPAFQAKFQSSAQPLITPMNDVTLASENLVAPNSSTHSREDTTTQKSAQTIVEYLKKYQMLPSIFVEPISVDKRTTIFFFPISYIFSVNMPNTSTPFPSASNNGLFSYFSQVFRQFRGGIRFKAMTDVVSELSSMSVIYEPPAVSFNPNTPSSLVNNTANSYFPIDTNDYYTGGPLPTSYNSITTRSWSQSATLLPITYSNSIVKTVEFEVPFTSIFNSILINPYVDIPTLKNYNDLGYLVINISSAPSGTSANTQLRLFCSLSDEARLANLYRVPIVSPNSLVNPDLSFSNNYESEYSTPAVSSNTLTIL